MKTLTQEIVAETVTKAAYETQKPPRIKQLS